jgi:hypothetical protein
MKNFLLIIIFLLPLLGISQISKWERVDKNSLITQQTWKQENPGQWGSFWWIVYRTTLPNSEGWYGYYLNCYSSSYLDDNNNVVKATSYIDGISITMFEYEFRNNAWYLYNKFLWKDLYKIVDWQESHIVRFWSKSGYCVFDFKYSQIYPYNYSYIK